MVASAARSKWDHRRDSFSASTSREYGRNTPVRTISTSGRTRDSNITGVPRRRVSACEHADDAVGAPAPGALAATPPRHRDPRVVAPSREFTARCRGTTTTTGASDDNGTPGILAASPWRTYRGRTSETRPAPLLHRSSPIFSLSSPSTSPTARIRANLAAAESRRGRLRAVDNFAAADGRRPRRGGARVPFDREPRGIGERAAGSRLANCHTSGIGSRSAVLRSARTGAAASRRRQEGRSAPDGAHFTHQRHPGCTRTDAPPFRGRLVTSRVVLAYVGARATRRVARPESNWPPRWGPTPHSAATGRRFCDPPPPAAPQMPLDVLLTSPPSFSVYPRAPTRRSRIIVYLPFANPLPLLLFPPIVSPYTRRSQIFTRDRKWTRDRWRRALCEPTARVSIVLAANCPAAGAFRGKLSGRASRGPERPTSGPDRARIPGTRQLTRSRRSSIDSLSRWIGRRGPRRTCPRLEGRDRITAGIIPTIKIKKSQNVAEPITGPRLKTLSETVLKSGTNERTPTHQIGDNALLRNEPWNLFIKSFHYRARFFTYRRSHKRYMRDRRTSSARSRRGDRDFFFTREFSGRKISCLIWRTREMILHSSPQRTSSFARFTSRTFPSVRASLLTAPFTFTRYAVLDMCLFFLPVALSRTSFFPRLIFRARRALPPLPLFVFHFLTVRVRVRFVTRTIRSSSRGN